MKTIIYIATGNKSKLANFQQFFKWIDPEIEVELVPEYIEVDENGNSLEENSLLKVLQYKNMYQYPVIANDSGLSFDPRVREDLDPVKVKRNALGGHTEKELSQEEIGASMIEFYKNIAKEYGGEINTTMTDVFTILYPDGTTRQIKTNREYILTDRETDKYDIFHPLNSLRISPRVHKFMDEMTEEEKRIDMKVLVDGLKELIRI